MKLKQFDDLTPMPFGPHKGIQLGEVPMRYLDGLWEKPASPLQKLLTENSDNGALARYIQSARKAEGRGA
jgi:hypothetical protein